MMQTWRTWQKVALLNAAAFVGSAASLFAIPGNTPLWMWATASGVLIVGLNTWLAIRLWRGNDSPKKQVADLRVETALVIICSLYFLAHVLMGLMKYVR
jgi:hypothetical protein